MKDLNLVPKSYYINKKRKQMRLYSILFVVIYLVLVGVLTVTPLLTKKTLNEKLKLLEEKVNDINLDMQKKAQFEYIKGLVNTRELEAARLSRKGVNLLTILEKIEQSMPERMFVMNFKTTNSAVNDIEIMLTGSAASEIDIAAFISRIRKEGYFTGADIISVNKVSVNSAGNQNESDTMKESLNTKYNCIFDIKVYIKSGK